MSEESDSTSANNVENTEKDADEIVTDNAAQLEEQIQNSVNAVIDAVADNGTGDEGADEDTENTLTEETDAVKENLPASEEEEKQPEEVEKQPEEVEKQPDEDKKQPEEVENTDNNDELNFEAERESRKSDESNLKPEQFVDPDVSVHTEPKSLQDTPESSADVNKTEVPPVTEVSAQVVHSEPTLVEANEEELLHKIPEDFYYDHHELVTKPRVSENSEIPESLLTLQ